MTPPPLHTVSSPEPSPEPSEPRERWLFLLAGGLLSLALLVAIGRERRWGEPHFTVAVLAPRADGLQAGMEVRLSGLPIGRVESLELRPDARVAVTLQINDRYRHLVGPRSRAQSGQVGLVGQTFLNLTPDPSPGGEGSKRPLPPLAYDPPPDLNQLIADLARSRQQLDQTLTLATTLLNRQVPTSLGSLERSTTKLSSSMVDLSSMAKTLSTETRRTVPSVRQLTGSLQRQSGQLAPALRRTLAKADQTLTRADQTAASATQTSQEATALLRQARPALIPTLDNMREITGAANRLVRFLSVFGLLEPGSGTPRSPRSPSPPPPGQGMDPHKVHPTSPGPSPYLP
ncbi:MAG: MlaD family protein [Cyanobacteriota bacterium]|nr:MlaD family protein [Cyanobacteriota bacterium]